jgi:hypothetical protein
MVLLALPGRVMTDQVPVVGTGEAQVVGAQAELAYHILLELAELAEPVCQCGTTPTRLVVVVGIQVGQLPHLEHPV